MQLDHYITLGHSGLRVSPTCLGTMTFGDDLGRGSNVQASEAIIDRYLERGGNFIDTAPSTRTDTPRRSSATLLRRRSRRDRIVLATKFFGGMYPGDPNSGGANRKNVLNSAENSLRRLQTDYIDLYWMRASDPTTPIEETLRALDELSKSTLSFPASIGDMAPPFAYAGTTINGKSSPIASFVPQKNRPRY